MSLHPFVLIIVIGMHPSVFGAISFVQQNKHLLRILLNCKVAFLRPFHPNPLLILSLVCNFFVAVIKSVHAPHTHYFDDAIRELVG